MGVVTGQTVSLEEWRTDTAGFHKKEGLWSVDTQEGLDWTALTLQRTQICTATFARKFRITYCCWS